MTPYADFPYFLLLLYGLAPALALGFLGRMGRGFILAASAGMIALYYAYTVDAGAAEGTQLHQVVFLAAYVAGSVAVVYAFAATRGRGGGRVPYYAAIVLVVAPLAAVKAVPLLAAHHWLGLGAIAPPAGAGTGTLHAAAAHPPSSVRPSGHTRGNGSSTAVAGAGGAGRTAPLDLPGLIDTFGFLGISYMMFRVVDVLILIRDGVLGETPALSDLLAYLLFFPTISAGPIDRFRRFTADLRSGPPDARAYAEHVEAGIHRIAQGFLYKFIIADLLYRYALVPAARAPGLGGDLAYMYAYSFYLFFDFAGYSAFAIGVARFLGIRVPENFAGPFLSANFREMWNRWNMTLSFWFRDHVYMRFMLGATRRRWFGGNRVAANYAALIVTMGLMGCWHGLALNYIVYGLYQGGMLVAYDALGRWNRRRHLIAGGPVAKAASVFATFNLFCFGLLIFSGHLFR